LLEAAGIQIPPHVQGNSLFPLLRGAAEDTGASAIMEANGWKTLRAAGHRYLIHDDGRESLWDLKADPREYRDVAGEDSYREVLAAHRLLLLRRLLVMERPLARSWTY